MIEQANVSLHTNSRVGTTASEYRWVGLGIHKEMVVDGVFGQEKNVLIRLAETWDTTLYERGITDEIVTTCTILLHLNATTGMDCMINR